MNKFKHAFLRSHTPKITEDRTQQFVKRLSANAFSTPVMPDDSRDCPRGPPTIRLDNLSSKERPAYQSWWKDLDPFNLGKLDNEAVLKFLGGCGLPDTKLEQILALFEDAFGGLNELQFYAMLRLIAHAQNGRKVSRDLVFLGAPVPRFQTNAIDALITSNTVSRQTTPPQRNPAPATEKCNTSPSDTWASSMRDLRDRNSWWGQPCIDLEQSNISNTVPSVHQRRSVATTPSSTTTCPSHPPTASWTHDFPKQVNPFPVPWDVQPPPPTPAREVKNENKAVYTHSRSRSVPSSKQQDLFAISPEQKPSLHTSRSSIDAASFQRLQAPIDTGQSLLLTKKFVYNPPKSTNPFDNEYADEDEPTEEYRSPFEDQDLLSVFTPPRRPNDHPNTDNIPPPPVPAQDTKPAFPRYARNVPTSLLKRSQSYGAHHTEVESSQHDEDFTKLFRHKSVGYNR
ncbi:Epidermal growth factor receptor substrate 15 [Apophysomyces ossiformis]|uniref:Epidermal growth factor receptor substrate 15 n=1 Tax=Apophysomyces ossiformis TaxID=679940 RepID=A0A8H7BK54_9FUNG|nr:Epidermal growth factor receptor substrate 15 [Apophysomyces ossiformis]